MTIETATPATGQTRRFEADVAKLLHLMVHSVYSDRDVFLRELIANAADACERLRYESIARPDLLNEDAAFAILIALDPEAGTLTVTDNGIGMDEDDLTNALGTIARSGTRAFLDRLGEGGDKNENLIGQFGIGFYSAFMVAGEVTVETRKAGAAGAWRWTSQGKGDYAIAPLALEDAPARGTRVILKLSEAGKDYAQDGRVEEIVREHSGGVPVPVDLIEKPGAEARRVSDGAALWAKPKTDVTQEQYAEFYRGLARQFDEPALTVHWRAEGRHEYHALAFVPGARPLDLFDPARKGRAKLYVRRVLITEDADLLPGWLRFVRLLVDSADIPLNVSREMVQESPVFAAIKKGVTNRIVQELTKLADNDPETFAKVWQNFGAVIKEGLYEAPDQRDALFKLARFATTKHANRTLADYVKDLRENQTAIYYLAGDDAARVASSPQLEGFRARGIEVLLLSDPVDSFWITTAAGFDGKPFKSVTQGAADIKNIALAEGETAPASDAVSAEAATLLAFFKETLGDSVSDVRASDRLSTSAACLVAADNAMDRRLERILAMGGQAPPAAKPVLEINAAHALIGALATRFRDAASRDFVADAAWLMLDEARLMDGEAPADAAAFSQRLTRVLEKAAG